MKDDSFPWWIVMLAFGLMITVFMALISDQTSSQSVISRKKSESYAAREPESDAKCTENRITPELSGLIADSTLGHFGLRMIYVKDIKDISQISRTDHEVRCELTMHTNRATDVRGVFSFVKRDGRDLVRWNPNVSE